MNSEKEKKNGNGADLVLEEVVPTDDEASVDMGMSFEVDEEDPAYKEMLALVQQQQQDPSKNLLETFLSVPGSMQHEFVKKFPVQTFVDKHDEFHKKWVEKIGEYKEILKTPRELNAKERDEFLEKFTTFETDNAKMVGVVNDVILDKLYGQV